MPRAQPPATPPQRILRVYAFPKGYRVGKLWIDYTF